MADSDKYASLAAAMSLISIDVFGSDAPDCNVHLGLARNIIQATGGELFWKSNSYSSILYQIFRCYDIVATTTQAHFQPKTEGQPQSHSRATVSSFDEHQPGQDGEGFSYQQGSVNDEASPPLDVVRVEHQVDDTPYTDHYILDTSFGIGIRTMSLLHRTVRLGSTCAKYSTRSAIPPKLLNEIHTLKCQLYSIEENPMAFNGGKSSSHALPQFTIGGGLSTPTLGRSSDPVLPKTIRDELLEHHQWGFHYAVILYFHRVFPASYLDSPDASKPDEKTPDHQGLIGKILDRLENIDCLTPQLEVGPANTLWPAFIAAVEAIDVDLRHRVLIWFSKAAKKGIGNIARAKQLVMEIWRRVDRQVCDDEDLLLLNHGLGPIDWRTVMEETGPSIMLT
jgi:hypothetical protein